MKTMLLTRPAPPGSSPVASNWLAATTWLMISPVDMLRCRPPWPVAQKGQAMPQPACELMHNVVRTRPTLGWSSASPSSTSPERLGRTP